MKIFVSLIDGVKSVKEEIDFKDNIKNNVDIIEIGTTLVTGEMKLVNEQLEVDLNVKVDLVLASSRSLQPIEYKLDFNLDLIFGSSLSADYPIQNEINFDDIIYGHILLEKPLSIYLDSETPIEQPKVKNPAFKGLEDWNL